MTRPKEYYFKEGCFIEEWHNSAQDPDMSVARVRVQARQTTKLHSLSKSTERYVILSGRGRVCVGETQWNVAEGDVVVINPDIVQNIENLTDDDLLFLAICSPRFQEENYSER